MASGPAGSSPTSVGVVGIPKIEGFKSDQNGTAKTTQRIPRGPKGNMQTIFFFFFFFFLGANIAMLQWSRIAYRYRRLPRTQGPNPSRTRSRCHPLGQTTRFRGWTAPEARQGSRHRLSFPPTIDRRRRHQRLPDRLQTRRQSRSACTRAAPRRK